jgi:hypothetical protein
MSQAIASYLDLTEFTNFLAANTPTRLRLFVNNHMPAKTDLYATYTASAEGIYYAPAAGAWTPTLQGDSSYTFALPTQAVIVGAGQTLYGIFWTDAANNLLGAAQFSAPIVVGGSPTAYNFDFSVNVN